MEMQRFLRLGLSVFLFIFGFSVISSASDDQSEIKAHNEIHQREIAKANAAVALAKKAVEGDATRLVYHLQPPALWNNDPNGPIYYKGEYHMFYQHNPYGENWGHMHWGHMVSKDLAHWRHLPIALAPSKDKGEDHCFSGCCVIDDKGVPTMLYTSIGPKTPAGDGAVQWAAISHDDMLTWDKHPANPVMTEKLHGDMKVLDWRDPFVFKKGKDWFVVLGGHPKDGRGAAFVYRSKNLVDWEYLNILYQSKAEHNEKNWECPNFFKLGDKYTLIYSPHSRVMYHTGSFNEDFTFTSGNRALLDYSNNFYAPNCLEDAQGRRIMWGWIRDIKGKGWNGAMTLPRIMTMLKDGSLGMKPAPELKELHRNHRIISARKIASTPIYIESIEQCAKEITAVFEPGSADSFGLVIKTIDEKAASVPILFDLKNKTVGIEKNQGPFELLDGETQVKFQLFIDKAVVELYVNDRACCTTVIPALNQSSVIYLTANGGSAMCKSVDIWDMASIW